jgi:uncharacterized protein YycO
VNNFEKLFLKEYDDKNYNCSHFVVDAYREITGIDISDLLLGFMCERQDRKVFHSVRENFGQINVTKNKTLICLMSNNHEKHAGVFYKNKILHLRKNGVEYQTVSVATRFFKKVNFYECLRR